MFNFNPQEIQERTTQLQKECHATIDAIANDKNLTFDEYQDITNVWIFNKLAKLELYVENLDRSRPAPEF